MRDREAEGVLSPLLGFALGFGIMLAIVWAFRRVTPGRVDWLFRRLQLLSAAHSLGHGINDAQKPMGIVAVLLFSTGYRLHEVLEALVVTGIW